MSKLINTYPVFESSQVLTSSQLNHAVSYLDQQSRLTRVKLTGMGIVCGLELSTYKTISDTESNIHIVISKGTAITSEGFLITLGHCDTSWYRPYSLPEGVTYKPFEEPDKDIILYELLKDLPEDTTGVEELDNSDGFLNDKFVLLFLETFDNDLKSCLGNTCDELGIDRVFTVRKLLISKVHLKRVLKHSGNVGQQYPEYPDKYNLPDILIPRTLFDPKEENSKNFSAFTDHHTVAIQTVFSALFGEKNDDDDTRTPEALHQTYSVYDLLLGPEYDQQNPFGTVEMYSRINDLESYFEGASDDTLGIQYFTDFLKDLILAYDEFRVAAFDLMAECCPDMSLFPKHIMLGRALVPEETPEEAHTYRHGFTQPPIYNHQKYLIEKTIALHKRMVLMVNTFNLDRIKDPVLVGDAPQQLRITPSNEKNTPLSDRSIPYYYDSKVEVPTVGEGNLEHFWNFDTTRKKLPGTTKHILSYENQSDDQMAIASPLETPLYYDLDSYPFLRIEGHIGHDYEVVMEKINNLKSDFNLPFDTMALQLDPNASLLELDFSCGFEDLQEEYATARNTYCGFIRDLTGLFQFALGHKDTIFDDSAETLKDLRRIQEILKSLQQLCNKMTECLREFNFSEFQQSYKTALQLILDFVLVEKELLNEFNVDEKNAEEKFTIINGMIQQLSPVLFRVVDLLFYNTFLRIYYGFKRREYYLQRKTGTFSNYIRQHPGVQHQAGVPKGGTFILVYLDGGSSKVIADFNLPYLCCGTENCVPMCDNEVSDFKFEIPPLARPDFAITTVNTAVDIHVTINDYDFLNNELGIKVVEGKTANGGSIKSREEGVLQYEPKAGFSGFDTFQYTLSGAKDTDIGTVTVLVKKPKEEAGCYSTEILEDWGIVYVEEALELGGVNVTGWSNQEKFDTLLQNLRRDKGFTESELQKLSVVAKQMLLDSLDISYNSDSDLVALIKVYENEHCGEQEEQCEVTEVTGKVIDGSGNGIPGVKIIIMGTTQGTDTDKDGKFDLVLDEPGQTLVISKVGFQTQNVEVCNKAELKIELQNNEIESPGVLIYPDLIDTTEIVNILGVREVTIEENSNRQKVLETLESSKRGNTFSKEELQLLKNDTLKKVINEKKISSNVNDTKDVLIRKLMKG